MAKLILIICLLSFLTSCYRTENGIVLGLPDYEKRDIKVTSLDLKILLKSKDLLSSESDWIKDSLRECNGNSPYNLYCALETASKTVAGKHTHRRAALQEVRFTIDDNYKNRWKIHRLADFNAHNKTTHQDVILVLNTTIERVKQKLTHNKAGRVGQFIGNVNSINTT